jgi:myo-inositol-1-phosphate synthase
VEKIRVAIVGVGNCASSLVQGIHHYDGRSPDAVTGIAHWEIGGRRPGDVEAVAAFDVDARKVGRDLADAIFAEPNCTTEFQPGIAKMGVPVRMGRVLDGLSEHMAEHPEHRSFRRSDAPEADHDDVVHVLRESGAQVVINYLPVGSERAARFYAECALAARCGFVNCIPVFLASDPIWAAKFVEAGLPIVGDDIKAQLGATITHRTLTDLFRRRGVELDRTYQLNTGGNTDFLNMLNRDRLAAKKESKTEAVQSVTAQRLEDDDIHVGPSDYVAWQKDEKVCFLRMEGRLFGDVPMNLELRLSVEDSPNSAGVAIDAIRCCRLAMERGVAGPVAAASSAFMKHPPEQLTDDEAYRRLEAEMSGVSVQGLGELIE